jgi:hypothetical protein
MKRAVVHVPIVGVTHGLIGPAQCGRWVWWHSADHGQLMSEFEHDVAHDQLQPYCKQCVAVAMAKRRRRGVVPSPA